RSTVGAVGRVLQSLAALSDWRVHPATIVLMGVRDDYALEQIALHANLNNVYALGFPRQYDSANLHASALEQRSTLAEIREHIRQATDRAFSSLSNHEVAPVGTVARRASEDRQLLWRSSLAGASGYEGGSWRQTDGGTAKLPGAGQ